MSISKSRFFVTSGLFVLMGAPVSASAQSVGSTSGEPTVEIDEIVVTANKRTQSINDVPMSITAVSGDSLVQAGVQNVADLARLVPGYTFTKTHDSIPVLSIRGVGYYDNYVGATPAVSVYVDEVPLPYPVMTAGTLLDLERVEVLKGPQGTLFGQNSTGGALNFIAAKPLSHTQGAVSVGYGRFDTAEATAYLTGPLSDTLSARISGKFESGSAWQRSYTRNDKSGRVDRDAARLLLDWKPGSAFRAELTLETWGDRSDTQQSQLIGLAPQISGLQHPDLATGGFDPVFDPLTPVYPNAPKDPRAADWTPGVGYRSDNRYKRVSLRTEYDLSASLTVTAITSYQDFRFRQRADGDATSLRIADFQTYASIHAFYQELRLQGENGPLTWMMGGNYSKDRVNELTLPNFQDWSISTAAGSPIDQAITTNVRTRVVAGFANAEWKLADTLTLQGGLRYTEHKQTLTGCSRDSGNGNAATALNNLFFAGAPLFQPGDCLIIDDLSTPPALAPENLIIPLKEHNISWRAGINYQPNRDVLVYANISKGYKAGAFTLITGARASQAAPATQESLLAYEAGFKIGGPQFQINGAAFYYDYRDKQLLAPFDYGPPAGLLDKLQNVPKSRIVGAELQATLRPAAGVQFSINGTHIKSKVTSSFLASDPLGGGQIDLKGAAFPNTAPWQILVDGGYSFALSDAVKGSIGSTLSFRSKSNGRFGGGQLYTLNDYALLDLRAGLAFGNDKYSVDVYGRNVTNQYYRINATTNADTVIAFSGPPATYGIRGTVRF